MSPDPSESLQRLIDEEPFVRMLARSLLEDEADDVIQQTWLHVVRDGGGGVTEPRSWLARVVYNVAHNLRRGQRRRARHEPTSAPGTPIVASPAEPLEREDSRRQLVTAVNELPDHLRTAVLLRYFDQLPPRLIAVPVG